jgi:hypothetical protein
LKFGAVVVQGEEQPTIKAALVVAVVEHITPHLFLLQTYKVQLLIP